MYLRINLPPYSSAVVVVVVVAAEDHAILTYDICHRQLRCKFFSK